MLMLIIDGDYPMSTGAIDLNRDLTQPLEIVRSATPDRFALSTHPDSETMASLPEMRRSGVAVALVKVVGRIQRSGSPLWGYRSGEVAYAVAQAHLAYYKILEKRGQACLLKTSREFAEHMKTWAQAKDRSQLPVGMVLGMEGADPILSPEQVHEWREQGLRVVSLSHYGVSTYGHGTGTGTSGGLLLPAARSLLCEMEVAGMILDVTHSSDASVRQAMEIFHGAVLASHQNCRALVPGERQFPDDLLKAVIDRGGVIGVSMDAWMLFRPGIKWGAHGPFRRSNMEGAAVTLEDYADHVEHICGLAGNTRHAAIGGDTDGQGGREAAPLEIDSVADYQKIGDVLRRRGFQEDDVANILYRNWQRFFETRLPSTKSGTG